MISSDARNQPYLLIPNDKFTPTNKLFTFLLFALVLFVLYNESSGSKEPYNTYQGFIWFFGVLFYALGICPPLIRMPVTSTGLRTQVSGFAILIGSILLLGLTYITRQKNPPEGWYTLLALVVSTMTIGLGWLVHAGIMARHQKVQHTLNLILQTRMSPEFQSNVRNMRLVFAGDIPENAIKEYFDLKGTKKAKLSQDEKDNVFAAMYLANFYEFMAAGIRRGDLDEDLAYDCIGGLLISIKDRCKHLISIKRASDPSNYVEIEALADSWQKRAQLMKEKHPRPYNDP